MIQGDGFEVDPNVRVSSIIPEEVHGFAVTVKAAEVKDGHGNTTGGVIARLIPSSAEATRRMRRIGQTEIVGSVPLTEDAFIDVLEHPSGETAERAATTALASASDLAKQLMAA